VKMFRVFIRHDREQVVGVVCRRSIASQALDRAVIDSTAFPEIHESHNISQRLCVVVPIEDVHFNTCDVDPGCNLRKILDPSPIVLAEVMAEEEVSVLVVVRSDDFERTTLSVVPSWDFNGCDLTTLGGCNSRDVELSELHLRLNTEKVLRSLDKGVVEGQANVSYFEFLKNVFLVACVFDLHVVLEVE